MTTILLLMVKKVVFLALAFGMSLLLPVRILVFKRHHWLMNLLSILTCLCYVYLAASQFMAHQSRWLLPIVFIEIMFDAFLFWRVSFPMIRQIPTMHKRMPIEKLAAEKTALVAGCFIAMIVLSIGIVTGFLHR